MDSPELSSKSGALVGPEVHIGRRFARRSFALRLGNRTAAEPAVGDDLGLDQEWRFLRIPAGLVIQGMDLIGLIFKALVQYGLQPSVIQIEVGQSQGSVFQSCGNDERYFGGLRRCHRIKRMMRKHIAFYNRRESPRSAHSE